MKIRGVALCVGFLIASTACMAQQRAIAPDDVCGAPKPATATTSEKKNVKDQPEDTADLAAVVQLV